VAAAKKTLLAKLKPVRKTGQGYKDAKLDQLTFQRTLLRFYSTTKSATAGRWLESWQEAAIACRKKGSCAQILRKWCQSFISQGNLPKNTYGSWNTSVLHMDKDLCSDLMEHLQGIGKFISAQSLVDFCSWPDIMTRLRRKNTKPISIQTARRWLKLMGYRWRAEPKGQYVDGHEREDVVRYWQNVFLPTLAELEPHMRKYDDSGEEEREEEEGKSVASMCEAPGTTAPEANHNETCDPAIPRIRPQPRICIVVWWHNESIFYAHDRPLGSCLRNCETVC
jgi:hypothetical protein